jgi:hypothetical protein
VPSPRPRPAAATRAKSTAARNLQQRIESFIAYFNATMAKPFRWTMKGEPLVE